MLLAGIHVFYLDVRQKSGDSQPLETRHDNKLAGPLQFKRQYMPNLFPVQPI
jgi:hypothetical protein